MTVHDPRSGVLTGTVTLPGSGTVTGLTTRHDGTCGAWFVYTDDVTSPRVYHYDGRTGRLSTWWSPPGATDLPDLVAEDVAFESSDGTVVHMRVLRFAGVRGPRPCLLTAYGGFGVSMVPWFSPLALAWLESGGTHAVAGVRGGGEDGVTWHHSGVMGKKQNAVDDLHAAAERLVADGRTTPSQLAVYGTSNGGLIVGAAVTQRPDLYAVAVCESPLLDMLRYERSGLGAVWVAEYGTVSDPEHFAWLHDYSPYHAVERGTPYPAVLLLTYDGDIRVSPWHAWKMCAALQWASTSGRPVVLRTEAEVGHLTRSTSRSADVAADILAFCAAHTAVRPRPDGTGVH